MYTGRRAKAEEQAKANILFFGYNNNGNEIII